MPLISINWMPKTRGTTLRSHSKRQSNFTYFSLFPFFGFGFWLLTFLSFLFQWKKWKGWHRSLTGRGRYGSHGSSRLEMRLHLRPIFLQAFQRRMIFEWWSFECNFDSFKCVPPPLLLPLLSFCHYYYYYYYIPEMMLADILAQYAASAAPSLSVSLYILFLLCGLFIHSTYDLCRQLGGVPRQTLHYEPTAFINETSILLEKIIRKKQTKKHELKI